MNRILTIPLEAITPHCVSSLPLMRGGRDFTASDLCLSDNTQLVLSGLYALRYSGILFHWPL